MNVSINGISYEGIWNNNTFKFETDMTLAAIEEAFTPDMSANIIVSEDVQEIARYYNKGLESITITNTLPRYVTVIFNVTKISEDVEAEINERIDDSDGAIIELAEIVNDMSEVIDKVSDFENKAHEIEVNIQGVHRSIQSILDRLNKLESHDDHNEEEEE